MRKSRDRDKKIAIACGLGLLAVAGLLVLSWDGLRAWYVGYRFIWLPEGAVPTSSGQSINASGEVAAVLHLEPQSRRAGRWTLAKREFLPLDMPLAAGESSMVFAINDAGDVVGKVCRRGPKAGTLLSRPFLWTKNSGLMDLPNLGGEQSGATAINERGQVVGWSTSSPNYVSQAFLWSAESGIACLGSLAPGRNSKANAINQVGWVVGSATVADRSDHPFLWKPDTGMQDLGLPSGFSGGHAAHINDQGEVLVNFYTDLSAIGRGKHIRRHTPFVWRESDGLLKLPIPRGFDNVWAVELNNRGTVLLQALHSGPSLGYLILNGVIKELPGAPGAKSTEYYGLNDKGWLVGTAQTKEGGPRRGFAALPVR